MRLKKGPVIVLALIILGLAGYFIYASLSNKVEFLDDSASGNTPGNLYNGGIFCEYDNKIYFANPSDNGYLYRMNPDCTEPEKLNNDSVAYINIAGKYIFYSKNNYSPESIGVLLHGRLYGLYRTTLDGKSGLALYDNLTGAVALCGNYIYYQHYDTKSDMALYRVKIDKSENRIISKYNFDPSCSIGGAMYFSNIPDDHNILRLSTNSDFTNVYYYGNTYMPIVDSNKLFYIDLDEHYSLKYYDTKTKTLMLISDDKVINYNVIGNKVFYVSEGDNPGLFRCNVDGSAKEKISDGNVASISCTSQFTFFQFYGDGQALYRVPSTGAIKQIERIEVK